MKKKGTDQKVVVMVDTREDTVVFIPEYAFCLSMLSA
jgi:hypothetical protein